MINLIITLSLLALFLVCAACLKKNIKKQKYLTATFDKIDQMTGIEFEKLLKAYYQQLGYKVQLTKTTGDYGADLILLKNGRKYIVQAKRYKSKVGIQAVQQIVAAKAVYNAQSAIVVTNNYYTAPAWQLANANHVYLIDRDGLKKIQKEVNKCG
ncbi:MAG: restriction endonuclease [Clostridiales bacterium]|nr:restriction endonuclease [Clostridiales bacterium]